MIPKVPAPVLRMAIGAVPALLLVAIIGLITFIALFFGSARRAYALKIFASAVELAAVLVGSDREQQQKLTDSLTRPRRVRSTRAQS